MKPRHLAALLLFVATGRLWSAAVVSTDPAVWAANLQTELGYDSITLSGSNALTLSYGYQPQNQQRVAAVSRGAFGLAVGEVIDWELTFNGYKGARGDNRDYQALISLSANQTLLMALSIPITISIASDSSLIALSLRDRNPYFYLGLVYHTSVVDPVTWLPYPSRQSVAMRGQIGFAPTNFGFSEMMFRSASVSAVRHVVPTPPPNKPHGVPDQGATAVLLGIAILGLLGFRSRS